MKEDTKKDLQKRFGEHLRLLREEKKLTKTELADLLGMERQRIREFEIGERNPSLYTLYQLSKALNVTIPQLTDFKIKY